jgi:predicted nucleic acid-binding protein
VPVVDASVWVSLCHAGDAHHARSRKWFETRVREGARLAAPTILVVEVAAAVRRLTGNQELALAAASTLELDDLIELVPLDTERSRRASQLAATAGVRGADAVYLGLAAERGDVLVTWDRQQLERGTGVAEVERPSG